MEQFFASQVDVTYVLSLYPSILLPKSSLISESDKVADFASDVAHLSRASSDASDDIESSPSTSLDSDNNEMLESKKMSYNSLVALAKFLQKKRYTIIERATAEGTEEIVLDAVGQSNISSISNRNKVKADFTCLSPVFMFDSDTAYIFFIDLVMLVTL